MQDIKVYTDGACSGNPGLGGYGVVLLYGEHMKELSGAFDNTTNNRMEILAAIVKHQVNWVWVKGHANNELNNRCDQLAVSAIKEKPRQMGNPE